VERLRQRADFLAAASGVKVTTAAFVLQARARGDDGPARIGFTVSRKVGSAVERNRVRRRLRSLTSQSPPLQERTGHDYVLVGRRAALNRPFQRMIEDLTQALQQLDRPSSKSRASAGRPRPPHPRETSK
jgi:ribonuclease P protein component